MGFTASLNQWQSIRQGWLGAANHRGRRRVVLWQGASRQENGESFNMYKLTAAHRSLPFGTQVRVTNLSNQRSVIVRINDRGPYYQGRIVDLSQAAAERLDMITSGIAKVKVEVLDVNKSAAK